MKKLVITLFSFIIFSSYCYGANINYGYNAHGQYVPKTYGSSSINYGYNAHGKYVPKSVGNQKIEYGYNAHGDYVMKKIGY